MVPAGRQGLSEDLIQRAAERLRQGGLVAFPTDTLYALGADPFNSQAVQRVFRAKHRPPNMGLPLLLSDAGMLKQAASSVPPLAVALGNRFWPGSLTVIVPKATAVSDSVTGGQDTVAVRVPNHPLAQSLIDALGRPVIGTSANVTGGPDPDTPEQVREQLGVSCDMVLDDGACVVGISSTIVDLSGPRPTLVRAGAIPWQEIELVMAGSAE